MIKIVALILFFFFSYSVFSQDNPYLAPIGAFEAITGNTGIGRDGSVGAVIYNPAGLASVSTSKISGSASAFGVNSIRTQGRGFDDENNHISSIPTQITSIFTEKKFNWAFSILVPRSSTTKINRVTKTDDLGDYVENIDILSQDTLVGPSIGFEKSRNFKYGLSLFLVKNESKETSDTSYGLDTGNPKYLDVYRDENTALAVFPMFGFLFTPSSALSFGVRFSAPSIQLDGHHESTKKEYQNDGSSGEQSRTDRQSKKRRYERPIDLGIGFTYQASERLKLLWDISNQFQKKYYAYKKDAYGEDEFINFKNVI